MKGGCLWEKGWAQVAKSWQWAKEKRRGQLGWVPQKTLQYLQKFADELIEFNTTRTRASTLDSENPLTRMALTL